MIPNCVRARVGDCIVWCASGHLAHCSFRPIELSIGGVWDGEPDVMNCCKKIADRRGFYLLWFIRYLDMTGKIGECCGIATNDIIFVFLFLCD